MTSPPLTDEQFEATTAFLLDIDFLDDEQHKGAVGAFIADARWHRASPMPALGEKWGMSDIDKLRAKKLGNVTVLDRRAVPSGACELCGKRNELRPYGPRGEWICFSCGMKDEKTTSRRFSQIVFGEKFDA